MIETKIQNTIEEKEPLKRWKRFGPRASIQLIQDKITQAQTRVIPLKRFGRRAELHTHRTRDRDYSDIQRPYAARGAARLLWSAKSEELLIEGPAGTGKTRAVLEKFHFCLMKYPGIRILAVRKTRESMTQTVLVTFEEKVVQGGSPILDGPKRNLRTTYRYPNGSELIIGGMDNPTKVMSSEYDMIGCFEATELTEEDFENLTTRLRNHKMPYQQIIADCNPGSPQHWLNKRANSGKMVRLLSRHPDNPIYFYKSGNPTTEGYTYLRKLERLSGHRYLRLFKGKWCAAEGLVYEDFDFNIHTKVNRKLPPDWPRIRVIDFGYVNPFVCQWWAIDPDGRMWMYREIYMTKTLVSEHAKVIRQYSEGETYIATIADWDAEDRATLENADIFTIPAFKDITPGIDAVNARLKVETDAAGKKRPRLIILRDAVVQTDPMLKEAGLPTCTLEEVDGYHYPKKPESDKERAPKEEPVKKDDHGMDCTRYAVAFVDNVAAMKLQIQGEQAEVVYLNEAA